MPEVFLVDRQEATRFTGRRRACDVCFQRKIKCDAELPQCNWCKHHNLACTYNRIAGRIKNHINLTSVSNATQSEPSTYRPPISSQNQPPAKEFPRIIRSQNNVTSLNGIALFSDKGLDWIEERTGEQVNHAELSASELSWANLGRLRDETTGSTSPSARSIDLPHRDTAEINLMQYTSSFQSLVFPVISKTLFKGTLDLAYGSSDVFGHASAKACVYSLISLVSLLGLDINSHEVLDCGSYVSGAQRLVPRIIQEMTVDGLQSLIMLAQVQYLLNDIQAAGISISIATRLLYHFGAHITSAEANSFIHLPLYNKSTLECHLRDLFWLCYSFDKDICLRIGLPSSINDSDCDLSLPFEYASFKSASEVLEGIRHLDAILEQWRLSLDVDVRPVLYHNPDMSVSKDLNTQGVILRLSYYHCVFMIHQANDRHNIPGVGAGNDSEGILSSVKITATASRSIIALLRIKLLSLKGESYWFVFFYIIAATQCLFRSILSEPLHFQSSHDVDMLNHIPELLGNIPIYHLTPAEIVHLKFMTGFTTELARLGKCAILKAQRESRDFRTSDFQINQ
ncbi:Fungal Zn(2)-Cys(6) binuclear cluster domain-containing protein [Penicillium ucsense]|uniref:Fungal Zn(2)-Cys(6) binuclear cluster domain-containing protein n=1 Tax=Penicillium ucsense TaxID=2839758 RepID=A0A8J8VY81_9EURO|nr:Fungal Zn(2)-Cys(6) binuclear cluster domain-containing protein [Penicillium ucsense]KAF7730109.1 Fungal Zn(2)-Cys(6) binuclear cluster domain-containing protein [Penicillium ucsense]